MARSITSGSDRARLIQSVGNEAQRVVETYDRREEARVLAESARNAVAAAAATGVGAVGLGAIVSIAATTVAADVTGIVMASVLGAIGFFILPAKRRRAKLEMREKVSAMRARLSAAMRTQFESEVARSVQRIRDGIAPYARFVRAEGEKLKAEQAELGRFAGELEAMRARVDTITPARPAPPGGIATGWSCRPADMPAQGSPVPRCLRGRVMSNVSVSPSGESFPLPGPEDDARELARIEALVAAARQQGQEIVVVMGVGFVGAVMAAIVADSTGADGRPGKFVIGCQRPSTRSYWKIPLLARGESPVKAEDPEVEPMIARDRPREEDAGRHAQQRLPQAGRLRRR